RIREQLEQMAAGGIYNVIILNLAPSGPLYGSAADEPPFLSDRWWELFAYTVEQGQRLGVKIWFYDQLGFSGAGLQARVVSKNPQFRAVNLHRTFRDLEGPAEVNLQTPAIGEPLAAFICEIVETPNQGKRADFSYLGQPVKNVKNVSHKIKDGSLNIKIPQGKHRLQLFYTMPGGFDYQNPQAGAALLDIVHGEMERRFSHQLGKTIAGSFQDEFPQVPKYSKLLPAQFRKRLGYDLIERLPALYDHVIDKFGNQNGPTTVQIRCDANNIAAQLAEQAFFIPLHQWHEKFSMLCGYDQNVRNADPLRGEWYYVDYFKTQRHYSAPGQDQAGDAKPHQSIAELYNRPRVWMEAFHSSGWGQTLEDIVTLLHPWMADGANLYNPHAIYYSIHGSFWEWAPPGTGWRQPYFVHYPVLADYVSRLCYMLAQGRHVVDLAVVHPAKTVHGFTGFGKQNPGAHQARNTYWTVQRALRKDRTDYIVIDEDSINRGIIINGELTLGELKYKVIILPATQVLAGKTVKQLLKLASTGGTVIMVGDPPKHPADHTVNPDKFAQLVKKLSEKAVKLDHHMKTPPAVTEIIGRDLQQKLPVLHRKIADRDFYFVLSDDGTPAHHDARFTVNKRKLWELPYAKGGRLPLDFAVDGIPEYFNAINGQVNPIHNYHRANGRTQVDVELADTPAPLIALRPPKPKDPIAIQSDLQITRFKRKNQQVTVSGLPRLDTTTTPSKEHKVRIKFTDAVFEGSQAASPIKTINLPGPFKCQLIPTCDNSDGSFAWPPSQGTIPVEVRSFRHRREMQATDTSEWKSPGFDDSQWRTVIASHGPRAQWAGPLKLTDGQKFEILVRPPKNVSKYRTIEYSLHMGIDEDPIYPSALGGKGRIPEEFIDLGKTEPRQIYLVRTQVTIPPDPAATVLPDPIDTLLRIGGEAKKRVFLNGKEITFENGPMGRILRAAVKLKRSTNKLEILAARVTPGRLRLFYQFLPDRELPPDPQWICNAKPSPTGKTRFSKTFNITGQIESAAMVMAYPAIHQLYINGHLLNDQGGFDPYFTSRADRFDITPYLRQGSNKCEIIAQDSPHTVALLLDGMVELKDGRKLTLVSDSSFMTSPAGKENAPPTPAKILADPNKYYLGETASMLLYPRPHPLPQAGWLLDQPAPPKPFDRLIYSTNQEDPPSSWFRFRVPPGATQMYIKSPGTVTLYLNGQNIPLESTGSGLTAQLPQVDSPKRIAAMRIQSKVGFEKGAAIDAPITFKIGPGQIPLGSWDELGLPHYSGGINYSAEVTLPNKPSSQFILDLGRVRGTAEVIVNGQTTGKRLWHPYRFDITKPANPGKNKIEIRVFNTLGPHFGLGHPSWHVFDNHTRSGIFGPVSVNIMKPVEFNLEKIQP
ncbi:MAG: glycosyl hydrolase, partial [Planctomycetota bacterium]